MNKDHYLIGAYNANRAHLFTPFPVTVNNEVNNLSDYFFYQNYPNPFNSMTYIPFTIQKPDNVQIKIYDVLGEEISVLLNEYKNAGTYNIPFNANELPSGVYFYRIISGRYSETKKMLLLR